VAILDIALVFIIFKGDVRLTQADWQSASAACDSSRFANYPDRERHAVGSGDRLLRWPVELMEHVAAA